MKKKAILLMTVWMLLFNLFLCCKKKSPGPDAIEVRLVPFRSEIFGIQGVVPEGWIRIQPEFYFASTEPASLLFQIGLQDRNIPLPDLIRFYHVGTAPKQIIKYDDDHWLSEEAWLEQATWFEQLIGIDSTKFR